MKKISMLSLMLMGAFAVSNANATTTVSQDATHDVRAVVLSPISPSFGETSMNFGSVIPTATAGTVVLAPAGTASYTNTGASTGTSVAAPTLTVNGPESQTFYIEMPGDTAVTVSDGATPTAHTMAVKSFTPGTITSGSSLSASGTTLTIGTGTNTSLTIPFGATLHVGANQTGGTYTATGNNAAKYTITY